MTDKAANSEGLVVALEVSTSPTRVRMTVTNPTAKPLTFCDYHTPFEGIRNNIFIVLGESGDEIDYRGIMAKRAAPGPDDYIEVAPGAAKTAEVDLTDGYELAPGNYTVRYRGTGISGLPDSPAINLKI